MFHTIFLDMDGVLCDFHLEAVRAHMRAGRRFPQLGFIQSPLDLNTKMLHQRWQRGLSLQKWLGIQSLDEFWHPIRQDPRFWNLLTPYPWMKDLLEFLSDKAYHVVITTHADTHPNSYGGKRQWLHDHGLQNYECITIAKKWRLVAPDCLLIDDFEQHINGWRGECRNRFKVDGQAILFPQPWNPNHPSCNDPLSYVKNYFTEMEQG